MVNRPKQIGTAAETAVLKIVKPYFPDAHRLVLAGRADQGDIRLHDWAILEVKGGKQAQQIGDKLLESWLMEAEVEANHAGVRRGFLITQRAGYGAPNAHRWWVWTRLGTLLDLFSRERREMIADTSVVRLELGDFLLALVEQGICQPVNNNAA